MKFEAMRGKLAKEIIRKEELIKEGKRKRCISSDRLDVMEVQLNALYWCQSLLDQVDEEGIVDFELTEDI